MKYGQAPDSLGSFIGDLPEVMYYLYLPVIMDGELRIPENLRSTRLIISAIADARQRLNRRYRYAYITARKGWASPDNPLNRPGWHCDGFGSDDMNYVWWRGPGTRFAVQDFTDISTDHFLSVKQFEEQIDPAKIIHPPEMCLYALNPFVVHATPLIEPPGCMRQFVKISLSDERYNLADNSHNYLFDYDWKMHSRDAIRNDPQKSSMDYIKDEIQ